MPTYEFACKTCGSEFEARVSRIGQRPEACPSCGGAELDKLLSAVATHTAGASSAPMPACARGPACGRVTGAGCGGGAN